LPQQTTVLVEVVAAVGEGALVPVSTGQGNRERCAEATDDHVVLRAGTAVVNQLRADVVPL
jgi:hypothetical protein